MGANNRFGVFNICEEHQVKILDIIEYINEYNLSLDLIFTHVEKGNTFITIKIFKKDTKELFYKSSDKNLKAVLRSVLKWIERGLIKEKNNWKITHGKENIEN